MRSRALLLGALICLAAASTAKAQVSIRGPALGVSGGSATAGTTFTLQYTFGQGMVDSASGGPFTLRAGFWGASPHVTSTEPATQHPVPKRDFLYQNTPNPFNPVTTIAYDLAGVSSRVTLRLYDSAGHLVRTLVNETQEPGSHTVTWRGKDDAGHSVASGLYLYKLTTERGHITRKLLLLQ